MRKVIRKADIILLIVLVIAGLAVSWLSVSDSVTGQTALVTVDGETYGEYPLSENQTIVIKNNGHTNKITIKNGTVQMTYSDCANQTCVKQGAISKTSQSIICLPNRVTVEIKGGEGGYDAISS